MPNARAFADANSLVDFTDEINNIPTVSTVVRELGIFKNYFISQTVVAFDKSDWEYALLTPVSRRSREITVPAGRSSKTYTFKLPYFKHTDQITPEDLLSVRRVGTQADPVALAEIRADKLEIMRTQVLQTQEYMKLSALQVSLSLLMVAPSLTCLMNLTPLVLLLFGTLLILAKTLTT